MMAKIYTMLLVALSVMSATALVKGRRDSAGRLDMKAFVGKTNNNLGTGECKTFSYSTPDEQRKSVVKAIINYDRTYALMDKEDDTKGKRAVCNGFVNKAKNIEGCWGFDEVRAIAKAAGYEQGVSYKSLPQFVQASEMKSTISQASEMKATCEELLETDMDMDYRTSDGTLCGLGTRMKQMEADRSCGDIRCAEAYHFTSPESTQVHIYEIYEDANQLTAHESHLAFIEFKEARATYPEYKTVAPEGSPFKAYPIATRYEYNVKKESFETTPRGGAPEEVVLPEGIQEYAENNNIILTEGGKIVYDVLLDFKTKDDKECFLLNN